jgi:two-component sensor histidine kinase
VDAILRGTGLSRPAWAGPAEWGVALVLVLAAWIGTPRAPMAAVALAAAGAVALALGGSWLAFQAGLLVDLVPALAPAAAAVAVMVALLVVEGRRAQARLAAALEAERVLADEHQQLLINELNHRVKNTLATVQSIAVQTLRPDREPPEARDAFVSRLLALSAVHNLLNASAWVSADLEAIVRLTAAPFESEPGARFTISGPRVTLSAQKALAMAMALNELAANAAKYGALSVETGRVRTVWGGEPDGKVRFVWDESGGPPVAPPLRKGFGTRLIQVSLARELAGEGRLDFRAEGLRCELAFPSETPVETDDPADREPAPAAAGRRVGTVGADAGPGYG